jgi:hypothetical protein
MLNMNTRQRCALSASLLTGTMVASATAQQGGASIAVLPKVAPIGTPRKITVTAEWPNACPPGCGHHRGQARWHATDAFCAPQRGVHVGRVCPVVTRYQHEYVYVPSVPGKLPIIAATNDDRFVADGAMQVSGDLAGVRSLSGTWFDPSNPTSILMPSHSSSDFLVGSWSLFSAAGVPRWNLIHISHRVSPTVMEAQLHGYSAGAPLPCASHACLASQWSSTQVTTVRVTSGLDPNEIHIEARALSAHPTLSANSLIFESSLRRFAF